MPGSWEIAQPEVLVVILTREIVSTKWALSLRNLQLPPNSSIITLCGMPFDHARNVGCMRAIENNFKWLFFLDDDVVAPPDAILKLISHNKEMISGLYFRRAAPLVPVMLRETPKGTQWITEFKINELIQADLVGAGCLLISTALLRTMSNPWFEWKMDRQDLPETEKCSEDFALCRKIRRGGKPIYVDTSVACLHVGLSETGMEGIKPASLG